MSNSGMGFCAARQLGRLYPDLGTAAVDSWRELLLDLKHRGLKQDPKLAIGDGALGFLGRPARGLRHDAGTALLGPQDHERPERAAEIVAGEGKGAPA